MAGPIYVIRTAFSGSHHLYHNNELVAKIEETTDVPEKRPSFLSWLPSSQKTSYKVTHLPGLENEHFVTVHGAATAAAHHHTRNLHQNSDHPVTDIHNHMVNLKQAIWNAASDHRMDNERSQKKLLDISKKHAELHSLFKSHFGKE